MRNSRHTSAVHRLTKWYREGKDVQKLLHQLSVYTGHSLLAATHRHRRRPYDLRHSFASLLLTQGAPIAYVSEQMGHQNIQLTVKLYGHLQPGGNRHWMNTLPTEEHRGNQWQPVAENEKGRPEAASNSLILRAGHGIRTRDFDLGKLMFD
jgi:hypothetical protein